MNKNNGPGYRVLHAPIRALYQPALLTRGLREHGVEVDLLYIDADKNPNYSSFTFEEPGQIILQSDGLLNPAVMEYFLSALDRYDIFHFHSGYTLFPWFYYGADLEILRKAGKKVFLSRWGCRDGRTPSDFDRDEGLCSGFCPMYGKSCTDEIIGKRLERESEWANVIINHEPDFTGTNSSAVFLQGSIDINFWRPGLRIPAEHALPAKKEGEVRVLHAVGGNNRGDVKGSAVIKGAMEDLAREGLRVDYREVTGISFRDLRYHILQSDLVIDQLRYGSFGSFARESMALGVPVIGHVSGRQRIHYKNLPVVEATVNNAKDVIRGMLLSGTERKRAGLLSRQYAEENFDYSKVTWKLAELYERALSDQGRD
ncbi:MAG: hypothetical protein HZB29_13685 [Nitrospinae bacterium]|nr:hypothetical protein [Nitrospinota bacterium]